MSEDRFERVHVLADDVRAELERTLAEAAELERELQDADAALEAEPGHRTAHRRVMLSFAVGELIGRLEHAHRALLFREHDEERAA